MMNTLDSLRKAAEAAQLKADSAYAILKAAEKENEPRIDKFLVRLAQKKHSGLIVIVTFVTIAISAMVFTVKFHLGC